MVQNLGVAPGRCSISLPPPTPYPPCVGKEGEEQIKGNVPLTPDTWDRGGGDTCMSGSPGGKELEQGRPGSREDRGSDEGVPVVRAWKGQILDEEHGASSWWVLQYT